ncbi:MAG: ADP-ribosylglycohydrolase family protein [Deltaproteobacteria bacterium]|nr:ADP-ribosylglycohydrolase family protein [Deltaproteobacteria bacterium]
MQQQILAFKNDYVPLADQIRGAVWGEFVGDAFCLGSHWIYDPAELERRFPGGPQGFEAPAEGHYHAGKRAGEQTHYGDGALLQLRSLIQRGRFDAADFGARFVALIESPDYRGYRDHAAKGTVANARAFRQAHPGENYGYQDGADDDQLATACRLAPVAALHFRDYDYLAVVERATRVCQNNERAVAYLKAHAMVLRELFTGNDLESAFRQAAQMIAEDGVHGIEVAGGIVAAFNAMDLPVKKATLKFGQSCPLANSFPAAIHCSLHHAGDFAAAVRATAAAGGDSAGRAAMAGAWLGASLGIEAIPAQWRERMAAREEIAQNVERLVVMVCGE